MGRVGLQVLTIFDGPRTCTVPLDEFKLDPECELPAGVCNQHLSRVL